MTKNYLLTLITFIVCVSACKKNDETKVNYIQSSTEVTYKITLSHDTITEYSMFNNNQLISTKYFYFNGATAETITKNANGVVTAKSIFLIGGNGYAASSLDSSYSDSGTFISVSVSAFQYQNGFLSKHTIDTGKYVLTNTISDDNIVSSNVSFPSWQSGCSDYYQYNSNSNIIDVRSFSNKIFGKQSKNLIKHASYSNGCPSGPSSNPASSNFEYEFNSSGYVIKMKNYYTPSYHLGTGNVSGEVRTTIYEYY